MSVNRNRAESTEEKDVQKGSLRMVNSFFLNVKTNMSPVLGQSGKGELGPKYLEVYQGAGSGRIVRLTGIEVTRKWGGEVTQNRAVIKKLPGSARGIGTESFQGGGGTLFPGRPRK